MKIVSHTAYYSYNFRLFSFQLKDIHRVYLFALIDYGEIIHKRSKASV